MVASSFAADYFLVPKVKEESIGGKYNARIVITEKAGEIVGGNIVYTKEGIEHKGYYGFEFKNALEWTKANTPENATFLSWWDYGHMISGYAGREAIIKNPSQEALESVANPKDILEFDPHERLVEVAKALTATDVNFTKSIMSKYNANYIFITLADGDGKALWLFRYAELKSTDYMSPSSSTFNSKDYTELGKQTLLYKLLSNSYLERFTLVYSDENVKIFKSS